MTLTNPKVSVIIPTYNRANDLVRCLDSLCIQVYKNFEVLVCDDGSTDNTPEVVKKYFGILDLKYNYFVNSGGPARPRNRGIQAACGDIIAFLDSDDWWTKNKLAECVSYFNGETDLLYHDLIIVGKTGRTKMISGKKATKHVFQQLLKDGNFIANSTVMVKKSILIDVGGICEDQNLIACEDYDLWLRVAKKTNRFVYCQASLGYYNESIDNLSTNRRKYINMLALISKYKNEIDILKHNNQYKYHLEVRALIASFRIRKYLTFKAFVKKIKLSKLDLTDFLKVSAIYFFITIKYFFKKNG